MSGNVKLSCPAGGSVTISAADTASNLTATIPAATDTLVNLGSTQTLTNKTLTAAGSNSVEATAGPTATQLAGNRNKIINGAMMIDQRNAGASVTVSNGSFITDRFKGYTTTGVYAGQQVSDAPAGFTKSLKLTVTSAQASLGSGDYYAIVQNIEGNNIADLNWGTANAASVTLSFWVKSSLTGTFSWTFQNPGFITYVGTFSISAANTWQKVTASISGPTSGTWATDTSTGIFFCIGLGNGSTYSTSTVNQWTSGNVFGATGQVNFISTNGATFYITGVQLEKGATATPFENRLYGTELALCQRYYFKLVNGNSQYVGTNNNWNTAQGQSVVSFPVSMRSAPSLDANSGTAYWRIDAAGSNFNTNGAWSIYQPSINTALVYSSTFTGLTAGQAGTLYSNNASAYMAFTAEL